MREPVEGLRQHPLSAIFPAMTETEFSNLVSDIRVNGQRQPGIVYEGMVLDGWHRHRACTELGIPFDSRPLPDNVDPAMFVVSQNVFRRHLNAGQRATATVAAYKWSPSGHPTRDNDGATNKEMAEVAQTSEKTVQRAKKAVGEGRTDAILRGEDSITPKQKKEKPPMAPALVKAYKEISELKTELTEANQDRIRLADQNVAYMNHFKEKLPDNVLSEIGVREKLRALEEADNRQKARISELIHENKVLEKANQSLVKENDDLKRTLSRVIR
ncbi:MAG: hypothetical protein OXG05_10670 [Gammaproteobacteria bacterium]|nr:hypothetical protein [Gammaproteobacteria bacterium]